MVLPLRTLLLPHGTACALIKMPLPLLPSTWLDETTLLLEPLWRMMPPASQPGPTTPAPQVQKRTLLAVVLFETSLPLVPSRLIPHAELLDELLPRIFIPELERTSIPIASLKVVLLSIRPPWELLTRIP